MGRVIADELELLGSHGISVGEYAAMIADVVAGRLRPEESIGLTIGFDDLPEAAQRYVRAVEAMSGARISAVGVGPDREETVVLHDLLEDEA